MLKFIIGADISKDKINFAVRFLNDYIMENEIENTTTTLNKFIKKVQSLAKGIAKEKKSEYTLEFVMEHTGIYGNLLIECLAGHKLTTYIVAGLEIKNSTGISRGKNDKIDARRIADYGVRFADKLKPYTLCDQTLSELKGLNTLRAQMVRIKAQLTQAEDDNKKFQSKELLKKSEKIKKPVVNELDEAIEKIEAQMLELIKSDESINENYKIAQSVPGVGKIVAVAFICATNNFTKFQSAKALGSYCGVVPFGKESGNYKGKDKISPIANKALKTLLHLGAVASISGKNAFAVYYQRKVAVDKKNKMLALNNVRNKIVKTMFACIKNKTKYIADYSFSFAA
ncbi:MAG: IS110 family transposase [Saprospiraceae bacterium]|jgi:transposase|nr:IS110 family transposase [Saprospiraceae bacterium]MBP6567476.1 IS110 family transposase [Saprospiraceae bacterium]